MNILFTCAGRRNYLINYFKEALNGRGLVFATDMQLSAPAMEDADRAIIVPSIYDKEYIRTIVKIIRDNDIRALISLNDLELPILAAHRAEIEDTGATLMVSSSDIINLSFDKWLTAQFLEGIKIKTPKTFISLDSAIQALNEGLLKFPLVVKPRWGSGSIGIEMPEDLEELRLAYSILQIKLKRTILNEVSKQDPNSAILIQEKLDGIEYGIDVINDLEGNYIGTFARQKLAMRAGETDKAISVIDSRISDVGRIIAENLRHIGILDCDVFDHNGDLYIIELNPRFGGGYPFSHEAGVNAPAIYIDWLNGKKDISEHIDYKENMMFSKYDKLMNIKMS